MKKVKLIREGNSQVVRLTGEFRMPGSEVYVKKVGNAVLLTPAQDAWDLLENSLSEFSEDFMSDREQPKLSWRGHPLS